jgi:hypothetical protein
MLGEALEISANGTAHQVRRRFAQRAGDRVLIGQTFHRASVRGFIALVDDRCVFCAVARDDVTDLVRKMREEPGRHVDVVPDQHHRSSLNDARKSLEPRARHELDVDDGYASAPEVSSPSFEQRAIGAAEFLVPDARVGWRRRNGGQRRAQASKGRRRDTQPRVYRGAELVVFELGYSPEPSVRIRGRYQLRFVALYVSEGHLKEPGKADLQIREK